MPTSAVLPETPEAHPVVDANDRFAVYMGLNASYDSGLQGVYLQNKQSSNISTAGAELNWGIHGKHYRRKDVFELNYSGHFYDYAAKTSYNSQDHALTLGYTRQISPRFTVGMREATGLYSNSYSILNSTSLADAGGTLLSVPNTIPLDDRTYYATTVGSLVWQKTARLSFSIAATNFLVRRNSSQLADSNGNQTNFDVVYRLTKRQTAGVYYAHSGYTFRKQFGNTNADSAGADYTILLSRHMDLSIRAGITKLEIQALGVVTPNPLVQAVLGIANGVEKEYLVSYAPDITITLNRQLRGSNMGASFLKSISPGNGLVLTSARESESVFYNLPAFRSYATQFGAGRDKLSGYLNSPGQYSSYYARFSLTRPVMTNVSSIFSFDFHKYSFDSMIFGRDEFRVSAGIRFSPGDRPVKFW